MAKGKVIHASKAAKSPLRSNEQSGGTRRARSAGTGELAPTELDNVAGGTAKESAGPARGSDMSPWTVTHASNKRDS